MLLLNPECSKTEMQIDNLCVDQERAEVKQRERQKRRRTMEHISTLVELGFSRRDAARALHHADGDVDKAYAVSDFFCLFVLNIRAATPPTSTHYY